ncbi:hypothetical protein OAJ98_03780 [Deltaproteobacteria bacterium]|nr:hypothetical protein [Deltaproteobacteria bacterium]
MEKIREKSGKSMEAPKDDHLLGGCKTNDLPVCRSHRASGNTKEQLCG